MATQYRVAEQHYYRGAPRRRNTWDHGNTVPVGDLAHTVGAHPPDPHHDPHMSQRYYEHSTPTGFVVSSAPPYAHPEHYHHDATHHHHHHHAPDPHHHHHDAIVDHGDHHHHVEPHHEDHVHGSIEYCHKAATRGVFTTLGVHIVVQDDGIGGCANALTVVEVLPRGPAAAAGIRRGDRIVRFGSFWVDGQHGACARRLRWLLRRTAPGTPVDVEFDRAQKPRVVRVVLDVGTRKPPRAKRNPRVMGDTISDHVDHPCSKLNAPRCYLPSGKLHGDTLLVY